eukprot:2615300-Rhodomonas_salina.2
MKTVFVLGCGVVVESGGSPYSTSSEKAPLQLLTNGLKLAVWLGPAAKTIMTQTSAVADEKPEVWSSALCRLCPVVPLHATVRFTSMRIICTPSCTSSLAASANTFCSCARRSCRRSAAAKHA